MIEKKTREITADEWKKLRNTDTRNSSPSRLCSLWFDFFLCFFYSHSGRSTPANFILLCVHRWNEEKEEKKTKKKDRNVDNSIRSHTSLLLYTRLITFSIFVLWIEK